MAAVRDQVAAELVERAVEPADLTEEGLASLPYPLGEGTRTMLEGLASMHLHPAAAEVAAGLASSLPTASNRVLLLGPPGSEKCMTAVLRALAKKEDASLLLLDLSTISDLVARAAEATATATVTTTTATAAAAAATNGEEVEVEMTDAQEAAAGGSKEDDTNVDAAAAAAAAASNPSPPDSNTEVEMEDAAAGGAAGKCVHSPKRDFRTG